MNAFQKLWVTKFLRVFISSLLSILLPIYLLEQEYTLDFIGIVVSVLILSNIPFNIILTLFIQRIGQQKIMVFLSGLMMISAVLFIWNANAVMIIIGASIGLISANGTETGPFQSIEQALISASGTEAERTQRFSIYNFIGYSAMSLGSLLSGLPEYLAQIGIRVNFGFYLYILVAIVQIGIFLSMTADFMKPEPGSKKSQLLDSTTKKTVLKLSLLFSTDAFGGGFIVKTLLTTWFYFKYQLSLKELALIFSIADIITAISIFLAPVIAKRIGLLNTMVATHLPSNIFLILVPFMPSLTGAVILLFLRQSISQMDVPTRQSYVNAIIKKDDRASAAAITNSARTVAQSLSPPLATELITAGLYTLPFLFGGSIKIVYDFLILLVFRKIKPPEEQKH